MTPRAERPDARLIQVLAVGALLLAAGGYAAVPHGVDRANASAWPTPEELDSLAPYVSAVPAPPPAEGEPGVALPEYGALLGQPAMLEAAMPVAVGPARERTVSAILIIGDRRVAVIDDSTVEPGDRLPGGARVLSITADRVVVVEADGRRDVLEL